MKRKILQDDFFDKQPERIFEKELGEYITPKIYFRAPKIGECAPRGIFLYEGEFLGEQVLQTLFDDFNDFLSVNGLAGAQYPVTLVKAEGYEKQQFSLAVGEEGAFLTAGETEGIRRGLIRLEDLLLIGGGNLSLAETHEKPIIKRRISRCFFSPTNRPPKNGAELSDEVDYYPDGYLQKLMHDGINAIWIYSSFDELLPSSLIPEFGKGSEKRIAKLNKTIEKCGRYGIEVFIFALEPISLNNATVEKNHPGLLEKYPQVHGNVYKDRFTGETGVAFCTYTDFGKAYCKEAMERLFTLAPGLGGYMSITQGERITTCSTVYENEEGEWTNTCPHCSMYSKPEVLAQKVEVLRDGMRAVKPEAEFVSWTYEHRFWKDDGICEYVQKAPSDVALMQNFEDNGRSEQLGKKRVAMDYWLSYDGPSHMFEVTANEAKNQGKTMYAKMQISCSHELASVPYIPAPGLIYDKLTRAKSLGVTGIMESWYFGNYPCLMSKAAELLSSNREYASKQEFLQELAGLYYAEDEVSRVVEAWELTEAAYKLYPLNIVFSYYGPMHDGVVWELALNPKNFSLPRSWLLNDRTDGDRIGECLFGGHTVEEAIELFTNMNLLWKQATEIFSTLKGWEEGENEQFSVIKAIGVLASSTENILRFYKLRGDLGYGRAEGRYALNGIKALVNAEIANSEKMIELCKKDGRLGFHSEAEGYKFFPEKLCARIESLKKLLEEEVPEVEARIAAGKPPLAYYAGEELDTDAYHAGEKLEDSEYASLSDGASRFRLSVDEKELQLELVSDTPTDFLFCAEYELGFPSPAVIFKRDGSKRMHRDTRSHQSINDERVQAELAKWQVERLPTESGTRLFVRADRSKIGLNNFPFKVMVKTTDRASWQLDEAPVYTLGKSTLSPGDFGWVFQKTPKTGEKCYKFIIIGQM